MGFGGGLKGMRSRETTTGSEGMLPQKKFKFKSSEMARNSSCVFFPFEVRSQCFSLAGTFDQHNRPGRQKFRLVFL